MSTGFIARVIAACARNPLVTILFVAAAGVWGWFCLQRAPLDAIPDLSDVQVIVFTEWMGQSPNLVEDQITYPISSALISAPKVQAVRGQSMFGMSFVNVIFEDGTDIYWARSRVLEYLSSVRTRLPQGVNPVLGPDATGVGWVFEYALVDRSGKHDLQELRSLQDWNVRYALASVPGVAEVASVGGYVKQYQVEVDPAKLLGLGVSMDDVVRAVRASNEEVGGRVLEIGGHEHVIRGRGYVKSPDDIAQAPIKVVSGTPVRVRDVARVSIGPAPRRGVTELNGEGEAPGGVVIMRYGENALTVIDAVKARLQEVERGLPDGVQVVATYDRSQLIERSVATLRHTLIEEMIVVSAVIFLFLLHARSALIPILTLPLGVLLSFVPMFYQHLTANIMSLGGIAVAIGAMVDASIILIENIHKKLAQGEAAQSTGPARTEAIIAAMQEVGPSIFFSLLVITISFLPVFTLEATEGRLFSPLAYTKTYSIGFASVLAVTLTPALAALLVRGKVHDEAHHPLGRLLVALYAPVVRFVVAFRWHVLVAALLIVALSAPVVLHLQSEFMPPLNEGVLLYMPTAPPGMSESEALRVLQTMDRKLKEFPEVQSVFGKQGRAETATDPAPLGMAEVTVVLKPRSQWRRGVTWDGLIAQMNDALHFPGMPNVWWMPIQTRTEMLSTGVRSPLGIQVFGDSLESIERAAIAVEHAVANVPGTRSAFAERSTGGFYLDFEVNREEAARHGLSVADVNMVVAQSIGGQNVSETVEGRERYPISVRYARELRDDPELLGRILIATPDGTQLPLSQMVTIRSTLGPPMIRSEGGKLVGFVFVDTDRAIADYVAQAREVVAREAKLPAGTRLSWVGQFKYFERAKERLKWVVPLTLGLVFLLLYLNTRSLVETAIVLLAVPFSLVGAVWLLYLLGYHVSVAVWVGVIALAGLDAQTGVVMLLYLKLEHARREREGTLRTVEDLRETIVDGAARRLRPKLMTVATMFLGLLPVLWSTGTGADVMKRIAAPMVGGLVTSFLLELTVYPAIFAIWKSASLARRASSLPAPPHPDAAAP
ncbi:MAG TPA: CusA/CzcA family heavy metal efflux RND transporter [Polyangiales bacterium]|jgi:Cu(I)/Ag(I) efflux system membrane protein CusA/SilA|nr:CusA/CzcA family heavy metal efflux RND transporter [Polyangiales bacterium]